MNLSSGGLAILAIAAIWFLVFLPSFIQGDQSRQVDREKVTPQKVPATSNLSVQARQALRARRNRTISATIATGSFVIAGLAVLELVASATGLPVVIAAGISSIVFTWLTVRAHRNYVALLSGAVRRVVPVSSPTKQSMAENDQRDVNSWQPSELPRQSYLQTGAIEIVELAEVVSIENEKPAEEIASIDEILRRRRHVG